MSAPKTSWILDNCHDRVRVGDIFIADYRGNPDQRFEVLEDNRTGTFLVRRPDGAESYMRPSTILKVAKRIERLEIIVRGVGEGLKGYER